jgi:hypothetical protein
MLKIISNVLLISNHKFILNAITFVPLAWKLWNDYYALSLVEIFPILPKVQ